MHNLVLYIGTSARDLPQFTALVNSIKAYNVDNIPVYTCVNDDDIDLFKERFADYDITFVKDSDVYKTDVTNSWFKQQLIKMNFWRLGVAKFMVQVDSDSFFIKNFRISDFMVNENIPYTIIHENKELKEFFVRHNKNNSLRYDNGDFWVSQEFAVNSSNIRKAYRIIGNTAEYDFGHPPCIWSNVVWEEFYKISVENSNMSYEDLINYANSEQQWYGETLLITQLHPIFPKGNMFKTFHFKESYDEFMASNKLSDLRYNYLGVCLQSAWSAPNRGGSGKEFYEVYDEFFSNDFTPKMLNGQFGEDKWIIDHINLPEKGVVVDVGADQPIFGSTTYFFEKYLGWEGISIDADERVIDKLKSLRKNVVHAIVSDHEGTAKFTQTPEAGISHVSETGNVEVTCRTLNSILEEHDISEITLLDIDVEGHELEVCRGLDWKKYRPKIVVIEYISPAGGNIELKLHQYFSELNMYKLGHRTQANLIFILDETV